MSFKRIFGGTAGAFALAEGLSAAGVGRGTAGALGIAVAASVLGVLAGRDVRQRGR